MDTDCRGADRERGEVDPNTSRHGYMKHDMSFCDSSSLCPRLDLPCLVETGIRTQQICIARQDGRRITPAFTP